MKRTATTIAELLVVLLIVGIGACLLLPNGGVNTTTKRITPFPGHEGFPCL